jgi:hypothetical protein
MTQKQKDEMNRMLQELKHVRNAVIFESWRVKLAHERLERFIRLQCGDKAGAEWA